MPRRPVVKQSAQIYDELIALAGGRIPVLCCFQRPGGPGWCHRSLVAEWFANTLGLVVPEVGHETARTHPLAPTPTLMPQETR